MLKTASKFNLNSTLPFSSEASVATKYQVTGVKQTTIKTAGGWQDVVYKASQQNKASDLAKFLKMTIKGAR